MNKTDILVVSRLKASSIIKLVFLGLTIGFIAISSLLGIAALFGAEVVHVNNQYVTGIKGLLWAPFIGALIGIGFSVFLSLFIYIGLRIYSCFRNISIKYVPAHANKDKQTDSNVVS